ncbi:hypothetical protein CapIbe_024175, partial [Capra ibex]
ISIPELLWRQQGIFLKVEQVGERKLNSDMTGKCQRPFTRYHLRKEDNEEMTLDRGFGPRAPVLALPWTAGHGPLRRLRALVGEMPELGELTPRSPRF